MDSENENAGSVGEEEETYMRPPSSYGSMKSEDEEIVEINDGEEEEGDCGGEVIFATPVPLARPVAGSQMQSLYTETVLTTTTEQTKPPGALVIETGDLDLDDLSEDEIEDEDEILTTCSPEPPEPLQMEGFNEADENSQPGKLHPEQDLPHIFKSLQTVISQLQPHDLWNFKMWYNNWPSGSLRDQILDGDVLDFVDKIIELYGPNKAISKAINTFETMGRSDLIEELKKMCRKAIVRFSLIDHYVRRCKMLYEGVPRTGDQNRLVDVYVEPEICISGFGVVDTAHEILSQPPTPLPVPSDLKFAGLNDLFRLEKQDGSPVKTVVVTGAPGVGMSVSVAKFALDWAQGRANKDVQYLLKISFRNLAILRRRENTPEGLTMYRVIEYGFGGFKDPAYLLEEENTNFVILMDCFDSYQGTLDWKNAPAVTDPRATADLDVLLVNLIRGNLLPGARLMIMGRIAATSQIPSELVDATAELLGFNEEMKDDYLTKRFSDSQLAARIVRQYKLVPMVRILARHPFVCWIVAQVFSSCFEEPNYGLNHPRLTPFLFRIMVVMINRMLLFFHQRRENDMHWTDKEIAFIKNVGKMCFKMLEQKTSIFTDKNVKDVGLEPKEVWLWSGLCTEIIPTLFPRKRTFAFFHYTIQEYMAAMYVFISFHMEATNVLDTSSLHIPSYIPKSNTKTAAGLLMCALARTLNSPLGQYNMFLRYLCGLLSVYCHQNLLRGYLFGITRSKMQGLPEAQKLLETTIQKAPEDRRHNLQECLREMTQEDD